MLVGMDLQTAIRQQQESRMRQAADRIRNLGADMKSALNGTLQIDPIHDPDLFVLGAFAEYRGLEFFLENQDDQVLLRVERECPRCRRQRISRLFLARRKHEMRWETLTESLAEWLLDERACQSCKERISIPIMLRPLFHLAKWCETIRHNAHTAWQAGKRAAN